MSNGEGVLLNVRDLHVTFGTLDGTVHAVNGISFELNRSEILGVVGESGCGKSVSMMSLLQLVRPSAGEVWFRGHNLLKLSRGQMRQLRGKDISMIFQDPMTSLNPVLTVGRQMTEVMKRHLGITGAEARRRAIDLLDRVRIPDATQRLRGYPHELSGGMRQRVMIAMALSCDPQLLIADEPTTALDVTVQAQILDLLRSLRDDLGMAVIFVSHDVGVVSEIGDTVNVMYGGYIVERGSAQDVLGTPSHPYTLGLLSCVPDVDYVTGPLKPIQGAPPDGLTLYDGCCYSPRCEFAKDECMAEVPVLEPVGGHEGHGHTRACIVDLQTGALMKRPLSGESVAPAQGREQGRSSD